MVLQTLEFSECLTDSPFFREKVHAHEKEIEKTSKSIKGLVKECSDLLSAASRKLDLKFKEYYKCKMKSF